MTGRPDAPLPASATGVLDPTPSPVQQIEPSIYQLGAEYKRRSPLSVEAMRRDPAYQAVVGMGEMGAVRVLNYTTGHGPSWLEIAVDEIAGQDISGLSDPKVAEGMTLEEVHERTHAWGETESLIAIRDDAERQTKAIEVLEGLKGVFLSDPAIKAAMEKAAPSRKERPGSVRCRILDAAVEVDGKPAIVKYTVQHFAHGGGQEFLIVTPPLSPDEQHPDWIYFLSTFHGRDGKTHGGRFDAQGARHGDTREAYEVIKRAIDNPPEVRAFSAAAEVRR